MPLVSSQPPAARPKLSVVMITYRHEAYIAKAIESVLIQNVDFPVELVIGEDCSPDGTRAIVRHYADKYPAVIRPLLPQNNVGMMNNFIATLEATRGEYVALLEGDDYWTDPEKLSKQVTYLEENPPCALCHHRVFYLKDEMLTKEFPKTHLRKERIPGSELAYGNFIQTCAVVFRRSHVPKAIRDFAALKLGDWPLCTLLAENGWIGYIDSNMAVYRLHSGGAWSTQKEAFMRSAEREMALFLVRHLSVRNIRPWLGRALPKSFNQRSLDSSRGLGGKSLNLRYALALVREAGQVSPKIAVKIVRMFLCSFWDRVRR